MGQVMALSVKGRDKLKAQDNLALFHEGAGTAQIRLTIYMVLTARRWRSLLDERFRQIDQSSARMEALSAIINSPPLSPQVDIARRLRIEGPTLTRMIDSLEKDRLVQRLADPADRRTKQLRVTEEGEQALEEILEIADEMRERLLEGFSNEQLETINSFFGKLLDRLDAGLPAKEMAGLDSETTPG